MHDCGGTKPNDCARCGSAGRTKATERSR
jgi:hypothetical protein